MSVNTKINGQLVKSAGLYNSIIPLGIADIYSTEERQVGCFVDGKPLYQITVYCGNGGNNQSVQVAHNVANIDKYVSCWGMFADNGQPVPVPNGGSDFIRVQFDDTYIYIKYGTSWVNYTSLYVTIQYTKTTDTAGSGIWTPSGAYAEHYSTAEHIVGTWIDGRTIYEKSWSIDNTNTTSWENFNHGISNFDTLINIAGSYKQSAGNMQVYAVPYYESTTAFILIAFRSTATYYRVSSSIGAGKLIFTARYLKTS